jgi:hypothetical protein
MLSNGISSALLVAVLTGFDQLFGFAQSRGIDQ